MRSLLTSSFVPLTLIGSTVLAAGVAANLSPKQGVIVRPAVFQPAGEKADEVAPPVAAAAPQEATPQSPPFVAQLSSDGLLAGTIMVVDPATGSEAPAADLNILFMQNGEIKASTKPGVAGVFQAKDLAPGQYALIASGMSGYIAMGVDVLPAPPPPAAQVQATGFARNVSLAQFRALAVPAADLTTVMALANAYVPPAAPTQLIQQNDFLTDDELKSGNAATRKPAGTPDTPYTVELQAGGKVPGQLHRIDPQTGKPLRFRHLNAFLVQGAATPLKTAIAPNGNFEFSNVKPGYYSVVAAGAEGFCAFGVHIVESQGNVAARGADELFVTVSLSKMAEMVTIDGIVIDMTNFPEAIRQLAISIAASQGNSPVNGPAPPGALGAQSFGGGGGLGGGAGGGGSGLGLLGAALGAAGLAAALDDDGGNNNPTSP